MKPSSAKAKGRRFQQEVAAGILGVLPGLEPDDIRPAIMGESGEDLKLSPAARRAFPYSVECKNVERLNIHAAIEQAAKNAGGYTPLVAFKKNRTAAYVALPLNHFLELIGR